MRSRTPMAADAPSSVWSRPSVHPEEAGVQIALLQALLDRGATFDQPSEAGNNHRIVYGCLANGQPAAAGFFADLGAHLDMESAAALGRLDVLRTYFNQSGTTRSDPKHPLTILMKGSAAPQQQSSLCPFHHRVVGALRSGTR
jgi:hypothetical protein